MVFILSNVKYACTFHQGFFVVVAVDSHVIILLTLSVEDCTVWITLHLNPAVITLHGTHSALK